MRPPEPPPPCTDDLEEYLRGGSALSLQYRRESGAVPTHALDRHVLALSRDAQRETRNKSPCLAPLAFAACVLLSLAMVTALLFGPESTRRGDESPRLIRTALRAESPLPLYSSDYRRMRAPAAWLRDIAALRRAGRDDEADAEYRRFLDAYPAWRARSAP